MNDHLLTVRRLQAHHAVADVQAHAEVLEQLRADYALHRTGFQQPGIACSVSLTEKELLLFLENGDVPEARKQKQAVENETGPTAFFVVLEHRKPSVLRLL